MFNILCFWYLIAAVTNFHLLIKTLIFPPIFDKDSLMGSYISSRLPSLPHLFSLISAESGVLVLIKKNLWKGLYRESFIGGRMMLFSMETSESGEESRISSLSKFLQRFCKRILRACRGPGWQGPAGSPPHCRPGSRFFSCAVFYQRWNPLACLQQQ